MLLAALYFGAGVNALARDTTVPVVNLSLLAFAAYGIFVALTVYRRLVFHFGSERSFVKFFGNAATGGFILLTVVHLAYAVAIAYGWMPEPLLVVMPEIIVFWFMAMAAFLQDYSSPKSVQQESKRTQP